MAAEGSRWAAVYFVLFMVGASAGGGGASQCTHWCVSVSVSVSVPVPVCLCACVSFVCVLCRARVRASGSAHQVICTTIMVNIVTGVIIENYEESMKVRVRLLGGAHCCALACATGAACFVGLGRPFAGLRRLLRACVVHLISCCLSFCNYLILVCF